MTSIFLTILVLGFVIFVHELGHLLAAKATNVGVSEFAIGMGPTVFSFNMGVTRYSLRLLPIGGFVKVNGMNDDESPVELDYQKKSPLQKLTILGAGSAMNVVLGWMIFLSIALVVGRPTMVPYVASVLDGFPASQSGIQVGDQIISLNGVPVRNVATDVMAVIQASDGTPMSFQIDRGGERMTVSVSPVKSDQTPFQIGITFDTLVKKMGVVEAITRGASDVFLTISQSFVGLKMVITGEAPFRDLAGPVGIIQIASSQIDANMVSFFNFIAVISISLGIINMMPFPALDGGHVVFLLIEVVRGRPLSRSVEQIIHNMAFMCLIGLMIVVVMNDVVQWDDRVELIRRME